ncbi:cilia- and flagella-associated protein 43-like [Prorops nasuta]|uniref:cilia- and flagella-associated protein 43-like n=1 Tax=Prorops nasuta TaxID=863751 RepID=UPI0034CEFFB7
MHDKQIAVFALFQSTIPLISTRMLIVPLLTYSQSVNRKRGMKTRVHLFICPTFPFAFFFLKLVSFLSSKIFQIILSHIHEEFRQRFHHLEKSKLQKKVVLQGHAIDINIDPSMEMFEIIERYGSFLDAFKGKVRNDLTMPDNTKYKYAKTTTRRDMMQRWLKFGQIEDLTFVGRDVVAVASGIYVIFFHLDTGEERIERFDDKERGDGASCLAGHPTVSIFCVAEKRLNPKISTFTYPAMQKVSSCVNKENFNGYLCCSFAGTDYLLSLTTFPDFHLLVWFWRSGERATKIETSLDDPVQSIACSPNPPYFISQFGKSSRKILIYQLYVCSKMVSLPLIDLKSILNYNVESLSWMQDNNLLLCDESGNIFLITMDEHKQDRVVVDFNRQEKSFHNKHLLLAYQNGVIVTGIDRDIRFYRKLTTDSDNLWQIVWKMTSISEPLKLAGQNLRDSILYHNEDGEIIEIISDLENKPSFKVLCETRCFFKAMSAVSFWDNSILAVNQFDKLYIFNTINGQQKKKLYVKHHGEVCQIQSHPFLPLIVISSQKGNALILNTATENDIKIVKCFHLCNEILDSIKFSRDGKFIGISNLHSGYLFIIEHSSEKIIKIAGLLRIQQSIADFLLYNQGQNDLKIVILLTNEIKAGAGNTIIVYNCKIEDSRISEKVESRIELGDYFKNLHHGFGSFELIGVPFLSKKIQIMKLQPDFRQIQLVNCVDSMHPLRKIQINVNSNYLLTFGYDGLVILRDRFDLEKVLSSFIVCHCNQFGIKNAFIIKDNLLSLGSNGDLMATALDVQLPARNEIENKILNTMETKLIFDYTFEIDEGIRGDTWLKKLTFFTELKEIEASRPLRQSILQDLSILKYQIKKLIDINEIESPETRLPLSTFDLNVEKRKSRIDSETAKIEEYKQNIDESILLNNRVASYIKDKFWKCLVVPSSSILSIIGDTRVNNFPLIMDKYNNNNLSIKIDKEAYKNESSLMIENSERKISSSKSDLKRLIDLEELLSKAMQDESEKLSLSGTTAYKWLKDVELELTHQLSDLEGVSIDRNRKELAVRGRERKLKIHFNRSFDEMRALKENEISKARKLIDRLNHCVSELKIMFDVDHPVEQIEPPVWHPAEIPDSVVIVKDTELTSKLYVDPSEQAITNKNTESNRKSSIDNFRSIALDNMMDGMLQLRWEDEIKREIPKPKCFSSKSPKFSDEDIEEIKLYVSRVERLKLERLKYKNLLLDEIESTKEILSRSLQDFDSKLEAFGIERIEIESAIFHEKLSRSRMSKEWSEILHKNYEISRLLDDDQKTNEETRDLIEKLSVFEAATIELKNRYENLTKREKLIEGKFQAEFSDLKETLVCHLLRHFKKRPKTYGITCTSVAFLAEMGKCVIDRDRCRDILPRVCLDFLAGMDGLDAMPSSLPSKIGVLHWRSMCKLRRAKIEMEIKVKSCAVELAEADQTLSAYQKLILANQKRAGRSRDAADSLKKNLARLRRNRELQLILKNGQIEIPQVSNDTSDFRNSILVRQRQLVDVNEEILAAGQEKLSAIRKNVAFKRRIKHGEWLYDRKKLEIEIFQEELKNLRDFKVTREVQIFLSQYPDIIGKEEEYENIERNLEAFESKFKRGVDEEKNKLKKIRKRIDSLKRSNEEMDEHIEMVKSENFKMSLQVHEESREREAEFRKNHLRIIARRTELIAMVQCNYEELLALHAQLEILKLRTYPTLKLKPIMRRKRLESN